MIEAAIETRRVRIYQGLDIHPGVAPESTNETSKPSGSSAILGRDYPGTRFDVLVDRGASVKAGEPVLRDRNLPEVVFTSPLSGVVSAIHRGNRRALVSIVIKGDNLHNVTQFDIPEAPSGKDIRQLMLRSGLWPALRCRPFGCIPNPDRQPKALLVTAIDTQPLAPEPGIIISKYSDEFAAGLVAISSIVDSPVYLCKSAKSDFLHKDCHGVGVAEFDGPHPAGLPGTHIHSLCPIGFDDEEVWHIGYQDVISLGHLLRTGRPWFDRVVSLAGAGIRNPRLLRVPLGASVDDVVAGELVEESCRVISGSTLSGHIASGYEAYLGMAHCQITAIPEANPESPGSGHQLFSDTRLGGDAGPLIPIADLDRVAPPGILAVPLLRALLVGDIERARDLGALELVEEDLALLSVVCPSKTDYGPLLRDVLNELRGEVISKRNQ
jgi:Na+-transporting NADH:ubiquinone oxidoreductase subunit A